MKILLLFLVSVCGAYAQRASGVVVVFSIPSGACPATSPMRYYSPANTYWGCKLASQAALSGTWTVLTTGGTPGTVTSVALSRTNDTNVTATITGSPITTSGTINIALGWTGTLGNDRYYGVVGASWVDAGQTTASTTLVDLTTADSVTFTCAATCTAMATFTANEYNNTGGKSTADFVVVDGSVCTGQSNGGLVTAINATTPEAATVSCKVTGLTAAMHTIKVQHKVDGGTGTWFNRGLVVMLVP